ncbi:sensor histidine kinase [Tannerella sp.]|uniref:tetratricopeptide repeat-containing sensor histidine kinase n=1 Tax=Tannerella sp. TaxID=2382127 RepID=UPI0026DD50EE|nr:sensor histidine kinase [Tannerella sp.]MDO4703794.1 sensor histidine kinase [Tannerella sp.]
MKNVYFYIVLFLFVWTNAQVRADELSELNRAVKEARTSEEQFGALMRLSDYWSYRDTLKAFSVLRQARPLTEGNAYRMGVYLFYEAGIYFGYDNTRSQRLYMEAEEALKAFDTPEACRYRARLWHNYGALAQQSGDDKAFLDLTLMYCIPLAEQSADDDLLMGYLTDVGIVFFNNKEYDKAMEYYLRAVSLVRSEQHETDNLLWVYLNMFDVHSYRGEQEKAEEVLQKAADLLQKLPGSKLAGVYYKNEARHFNLQHKPRQALESIEKGMRQALTYNFYWDYISLKYEKAQIYKNLERWKEAEEVLRELLEDPNNKLTDKNRLALTYELAELETQLGNDRRAYELMRQHSRLKDSINALDYKKQLAEMETRFRTAEKEQAIAILESRNRLHTTMISAGITLVALLLLWIAYAWNARRKRNRKDLLLLQQQREIEVAEALIDGQEQERKRLAQELHDGLVGRVTGIKMKVERLMRNKENNDLQEITGQLDTTITELRHTSHNLTPASLQKSGLDEAIRDFCASVQTEQLRIRLYTHGLTAIGNPHHQLAIYRIVQELITNALRHSGATEIVVQCTFEDGLLLIETGDNGRGFDVEKSPRNMGLNNIESRIKYLGGTFEIDSRPGRGTNINIECKLQTI